MKDEETKTCNCGCGGHDCEGDCECEPDIVELTDDNGKKLKFFHIGTIEFKNSYYAAFQPAEEIEGVDDDEVIIFEVSGDENGEESELLPIEDQDLLDEVYEEFCRVMEMDECDADECGEAAELDGCDCGCHKHEH